MKFKVVVMAGIFSLLTCFLTFPCFASELSTVPRSSYSGYKFSYKDLSMAAKIGMICTTEAMVKMFENGDEEEYAKEKIEECIKDTFAKVGWKYEP